MNQVDAIVIGAGPNGLVAAATLARSGLEVHVYEAAATVGGGASTAELTLPGFRHDPCSAVHPLAAGSPVLAAMPLAGHGLQWVQPPLPLAQAALNGSAAVLAESIEETADSLGPDGATYRRLLGPFLGHWDSLAADLLRAPLTAWPAHPFRLARFGAPAIAPMALLARLFRTDLARALLAGMAGHAIAPLRMPTTGGIALLFALAGHHGGWPIPRGGSQELSDALARYAGSLDVTVHTGHQVRSLTELPPARAYLLDTSVETMTAIADLPAGYRQRLSRYRRGPAVFKVDYALNAPVPWRAPECRRAGTVHIGATYAEIGAALSAIARGTVSDRPFLITSQPSLFDDSRAPAGKHTFWVYAHAPFNWDGDLLPAVETQLERFAPGFRDVVAARAVAGPPEIAARNPNYLGGDISNGGFSGLQTIFRPIVTRVPYATPNPSVFLCSSATPPGPGVHGMCGYHAARAALHRRFGIRISAHRPVF